MTSGISDIQIDVEAVKRKYAEERDKRLREPVPLEEGSHRQGPFTFRLVRASTAAPQPSTTCSGPTKVFFQSVAGAGLFRFFDGSLLMVNLTDGGDCIDFAANQERR